MPTPVQATTAIQDKIYDSIQVSQKAFIDSVRSWAETIEAVSSTLPQLAPTDARPTEVLETTLDFNKKVLASQREFATQVYEAFLPATSAPASAAQSAKSRS